MFDPFTTIGFLLVYLNSKSPFKILSTLESKSTILSSETKTDEFIPDIFIYTWNWLISTGVDNQACRLRAVPEKIRIPATQTAYYVIKKLYT